MTRYCESVCIYLSTWEIKIETRLFANKSLPKLSKQNKNLQIVIQICRRFTKLNIELLNCGYFIIYTNNYLNVFYHFYKCLNLSLSLNIL